MIRKDFIKRKISLIQDDLSNLAKFSAFSFDDITKDSIKQAAVERFLERIINRAIDINQQILRLYVGFFRKTFIILTPPFLSFNLNLAYNETGNQEKAKIYGVNKFGK